MKVGKKGEKKKKKLDFKFVIEEIKILLSFKSDI